VPVRSEAPATIERGVGRDVPSPQPVTDKPRVVEPGQPRRPAAASSVVEVPNALASSTTETLPLPAAPSPTDGKGHDYFAEAERATSLEQFVAGFHYTPPSEEDELTMTGDHAVIDKAQKVEPGAPISLTEEPPEPAAARSDVAAPTASPAIADKSITEPPSSTRSNFLDLAEPKVEEHPGSDTSTIAGPSFLGLSDPPPVRIDAQAATEPRSHWQAWVAVIVVLLFGGLGYMEWRSEKNQSNNGPIDVMRMQIQRLKGKKGAVVTPESTPGASGPAQNATQPAGATGSGPDMQAVPQQQKPQPSAPANGTNPADANQPAGNPGSAASNPPAPTPAPNQSLTPGGGVTNREPSAPQPQPAGTATAAAKNASPTPSNSTPAAAPASETAPRETTRTARQVPGAEELAKADNASDAAAASAWLWKAVAKGNPEAPIRLANMYIKGDGVAKSCEQALVLLRSAAAKENAGARSKLGLLYSSGTCVPRDRVRAYEYMSSALDVNPNAAWTRDSRDQIWNQMTPQERTLAQKYR
jgi:hypothetical protein